MRLTQLPRLYRSVNETKKHSKEKKLKERYQIIDSDFMSKRGLITGDQQQPLIISKLNRKIFRVVRKCPKKHKLVHVLNSPKLLKHVWQKM